MYFKEESAVINPSDSVPIYYYSLGKPTTYYKLPKLLQTPKCGYDLTVDVEVKSSIGASLTELGAKVTYDDDLKEVSVEK
jgi:hypothetical protein